MAASYGDFICIGFAVNCNGLNYFTITINLLGLCCGGGNGFFEGGGGLLIKCYCVGVINSREDARPVRITQYGRFGYLVAVAGLVVCVDGDAPGLK